jgi:hypothetical protein
VKYELDFYIPEDDILHSPRRENLKSYIVPTALLPVLMLSATDTSLFQLQFHDSRDEESVKSDVWKCL